MDQIYLIRHHPARRHPARGHLALRSTDKLKIARRLDEFGIHYIEGGWPGSNPKDAAFFERVRTMQLQAGEDRRLRLHAEERRPPRG